MERIVSYDKLPLSFGQTIYLRIETDPKLYISLLSKGYRIIKNIQDANERTIYVTGRRQDYEHTTLESYKKAVDKRIQDSLLQNGISKPQTVQFRYNDLIEHKYQIPFVLKNENQNGGREKFLINNEHDYENLIKACKYLISRNLLFLTPEEQKDQRNLIDYNKYLNLNFNVQEYISTPTEFNTTVRILTSSSRDLLYAALKYNKPENYVDDTTLLGYLLSEVYPLSTKSIVSNTLSGGENILLGEAKYGDFESRLLHSHNITSDQFRRLIETSASINQEFHSELGIICGFDYIYSQDKNKWYLLEYHSRPMVGDYSKRQGIPYQSKEERLTAEGRVRATALSLTLKKH